MNIFGVIPTAPDSVEPLKAAIAAAYPNESSMWAGDTICFVADTTSSPQVVCKKLRIDEGPNTIDNVIVIWSGLYWGRARADVWAWIVQKAKEKGEAQSPSPPVAAPLPIPAQK